MEGVWGVCRGYGGCVCMCVEGVWRVDIMSVWVCAYLLGLYTLALSSILQYTLALSSILQYTLALSSILQYTPVHSRILT